MSFKPFFIHAHHQPGHRRARSPRGFTAYITPNPDDNRTVFMQVTWCSHKDQFNKTEGRVNAQKASREPVNKRKVPFLLAGCAYACELTDMVSENSYNYVLKYFL